MYGYGGKHIVIVESTAPRSTATLAKTGQTTSYRTGDDGDLEAGRATDFLTLDAIPLHNDGTATLNTTTNRFTDTLGGSTYADNIVLDWSTWDGSTLLGWRRTFNGVYLSWNDAIDGALAVSIGSFTTGWKLPNFNEMNSIGNWDLTSKLNYAPFNQLGPGGGGTWELWTSTTLRGIPANAMNVQHASYISRLKTNTTQAQYMPCRVFSLSTLNVLS